jgi:general secretion pathway protein D
MVLRDARETSNLTLDRYELMRALQKDGQPQASSVLGINEAPVMPPERAPATLLPGAATPQTPAPIATPQQ